jgi:hypothetical protein
MIIDKEILYDYADGLLDTATAKAVERAVAEDNELKSQLSDIQLFINNLNSDKLVSPDANFSLNLMSAWASEQAAMPSNTETHFVANYKPLQILGVLLVLFTIALLATISPTITNTTPSFSVINWLPKMDGFYSILDWSMVLLLSVLGVLLVERVILYRYWLKNNALEY